MRRLSLLLLLLASCDQRYVMEPPKRFQGNGRFMGQTHDPEDMPKVCAGAQMISGGKSRDIIACFKNGVVHIPNPRFNSKLTGDALLHELGHVRGWPGSHPLS